MGIFNFSRKRGQDSADAETMDSTNLEHGSRSPAPSNRTSLRGPKSRLNGANDTSWKEKRARGTPTKWAMGIMNDPHTHEVPGSIVMLSDKRDSPDGSHNIPARSSSTSLHVPGPHTLEPQTVSQKTTSDGAIILNPQPDESYNDPLNWPSWRRDLALLSLGLYCMLGGGMTPVLAAGFTDVSETYHVDIPKVARTTGLFMMGLGVGSVVVSPTAILYGKRPVYLVSAIVFIATAVWCAASPSYNSLLIARIIQGISLSPVECLPSATIAEIFFLHERAYRIGIYTLLLLGGKNLVPLVSAAIIQSLSWRWVFWIVAIIGGFCWVLLFLFVPETFWDRTPRPRSHRGSRNHSLVSLFRRHSHQHAASKVDLQRPEHAFVNKPNDVDEKNDGHGEIFTKRVHYNPDGTIRHVGFAADGVDSVNRDTSGEHRDTSGEHRDTFLSPHAPVSPGADNMNNLMPENLAGNSTSSPTKTAYPSALTDSLQVLKKRPVVVPYTSEMREQPKLSFAQQLTFWNGRLRADRWFRVAVRPFILFAYPAILWSAIVYSCSIGWLIVLSESVAEIYRHKETYNFSALSTGLIYISPFIGGVLGTAVTGKVSDIIVKAMSKRNGGLYEPEFRLVMTIPVAITTVIGLMGFGWSAEVHDPWIVPTVFFGIISFGCSLGSTTAITFCVDSYRIYAGEALVTLNFAKNIFHGLAFSLFFNSWLSAEGSKMVFIWLGVIQLVCLSLSIPMYMFGKRARMWTVRKNFMEKF